jgi:hypothetical protein
MFGLQGHSLHALDFALHLSRLSSDSVSLELPFDLSCTAHALFPKRLSNHYQGVCHT